VGKLPYQLLAAAIGLAIGAVLNHLLSLSPMYRYAAAIVAGGLVGGAMGSTAAQINLVQKYDRGGGLLMYILIAGASAGVGVLLSPRLMALLRL
jgi:hypothetical protein